MPNIGKYHTHIWSTWKTGIDPPSMPGHCSTNSTETNVCKINFQNKN